MNQCFEKRDVSQTVGSLTVQPPDMAASPRKFYYARIFTHRHLEYHTYPLLHVSWSDSGRTTASHPLQSVSKQYADIFLLHQFGIQKGGHGSYSRIPQLSLLVSYLEPVPTDLSTGFGNQ